MLQTAALGVALVPVYSLRAWWLFILFCKLMIGLAAVEAASRPAYTHQHMLHHCLVAVGSAAGLTVTYYILLVAPSPSSSEGGGGAATVTEAGGAAHAAEYDG